VGRKEKFIIAASALLSLRAAAISSHKITFFILNELISLASYVCFISVDTAGICLF